MTDDLTPWLRAVLDEIETDARFYLDNGADAGGPGAEWARLVLAEVNAKRRILDEVVDEATGLDMQVDGEFRVGSRDDVAEPYLGDVLTRLLALPYADRPGYREEWRPKG